MAEAAENWEKVDREIPIVDETQDALARQKDVEGIVESPDVLEYRKMVSNKSQDILQAKNLPDKGETVFWQNEAIADKEADDPSNPTFSLLSWNIEWGKKLDGQVDYLKTVNPDILCLQEADWGCKRSGDKNTALEMAQRLGYKYIAYTTEFVEVDGTKEEFPDSLRGTKKGGVFGIGEGGGVHGQAILSKYPITDMSSIRLHKLSQDWEEGSTIDARREPRTGQRVCQKMKIQIGDKDITVYNAHLEDKQGGETGRMAQYDQLANDAEKEGASIIVGDMNTVSHGLGRAPVIKAGNRGDFFVNALKKPFQHASEVWRKAEFSDSKDSKTKAKLEDGIPEDMLRQKTFLDPDTTTNTVKFPYGLYKGKLDWTLLEKDKFEIKRHEPGPAGLSDHRSLLVEAKIL